MSRRLIGKVKVMSNKLRSFLIVVISIAVVMAALPMNAFRVNAGEYPSVSYWLDAASTPVVVDTSATVLEPTDSALGFEKFGYTFNGWNTDPNGNGTPYSANTTLTDTDNGINLYAQWIFDSANYVKVTLYPDFDGLEGEGEVISDFIVSKTGTGIAMPESWKAPDHYRLANWTVNEGGNGNSYPVSGGSYTLADGDTTLYGQWKEFYTITFNANDGTNRTSQETQDKDPSGTTTYQLRPDVFPYDGYIVEHWTHSSGGSSSGVSYGASDLITLTEDLSLNAYWVRKITFHSNYGNGSDTTAIQTIPILSTEALKTDHGFTNSGKKLVGWSTQETDTVIKYVNGESVKITGDNSKDVDVNLYAQWGDATCKIHFEPNYPADTTGTVIMNDLEVGKGFTTNLNNVYSVTGYTLKGWSTEQTGDDVSYNATSISLDKDFDKDELTLYAKWQINTYTITYKNEDGTTFATVPCNYGQTPTTPTTEPTKASTESLVYNFDGWSKEANGSVLDSLPTATGDATYYAHFKPTTRHYKITTSVSNEDGGTISYSGSDEWEGTVTVSVALENGYRVQKWTDNGTDVASEAITYTIDSVKGDHTVVAVLEPIPYTISVNATEGGEVTVQDNLVYGDTAKAVATANNGYTFVRWIENGTEVSTAAEYSFTVTGNRTLTAVFEINTYDIKLSSEGHGSVEGADTYNYSTPITVKAIPDTGYEFLYWIDEDGTKITSANYDFTVVEDRDLTAYFAPKSYNIGVTAGDNGSVTGKGIYYYGESITINANPETGYHFVNWTIDGNVVSTNANYTFTVSGPADLKANFAINSYTVKFVNDDGTLLKEAQFVYGSTAFYHLNETPTKKPTVQYTYTFAGWDKKLGAVTDDITYTATYEATVNKYKITFKNEDGSMLQTSEVEYGKFPVYEKGTPTKAATVEETFTFAGWDKEISKVTGETVYTATYTSKPITKDSINYKYFTVAFVTNGGSEIVSQLVAEGGVAFRPEEPLRERYTFGGWYIDEALTKPFSFATAITSDITLYAKWIKGSPDIEATYAVVGLGSTAFELGSGEDITVAVERSKDNDSIATHFKGVLIDGVEVAYYNYELAEDNSSVIIRADALEGLDAGTHTVTIVYDDGTAEVELVVADANEPTAAVEKITETEAGDTEPVNVTAEKTSNWGLWIALGIVAVVVIAAIPIFIIKGRSLK